MSSRGKALVACDGAGNGCVLLASGSLLSYMVASGEKRLDELGLDDAPYGLSVWEGVYATDRDELDGTFDGTFRDATVEELSRWLHGDGAPWDGAKSFDEARKEVAEDDDR